MAPNLASGDANAAVQAPAAASKPASPLYRAGALKLLRNALRPMASHWPYPVGVRLPSGLKCYVDLSSAIGRAVLVKGCFDEALGNFIAESLRPGDVFVDMGANIGYFSLVARGKVGAEGEIHAFEIDPRALRCLQLTQAKNHLWNLIIHTDAVGETPGIVTLVTNEEIGNTFVTRGGAPDRGVPVLPLDAWFEYFAKRGIRLMKVDVEGADLAALRGARSVIQRCRPIIVCEAIEDNLARFGHSVAQLAAFAESIGYTSRKLPGTFDQNLVLTPKEGRAGEIQAGS